MRVRLLLGTEGVTEFAPAATPLGQLQRGLGSGFLWALQQPPESVHPLLEHCILNDPRWDYQLDDRGDYYARLVFASGMTLVPLARQLLENADRDQFETGGTIDTLGALAKRGNEEAANILTAYVAVGTHWNLALDELIETGRAEAWEGLNGVIEARFPDPEQLGNRLSCVPLGEPPWSGWKDSPGPLGAILRKRERRERDQQGTTEEVDYSSMSTQELLDLTELQDPARRIEEALSSRDSPEDSALFLAAIELSRPLRAATALRILRRRGDPRVFEPAKRIIEQWRRRQRSTPAERRRYPLVLYSAANRALRGSPSHIALPLARRWRSSPSPTLRHSAQGVLRSHATEDDVPWVRRQLRWRLTDRRVTDRRVYTVCGYAEILTRFPRLGPFPGLGLIYHQLPYSYGRRFFVRAMAATDPAFPGGLAYECLWDCQSDTRVAACQVVDLNVLHARERLQEMAADAWEEAEVREAASTRL